MKAEQKRQFSLWDILAAGLSVWLLVNFLLFCVLLLISLETAFDPVLAFLTGVQLLLGLCLLFPAKRLQVRRPLRKLLLAGVICNALVVLFFCGTVFLLLSSW